MTGAGDGAADDPLDPRLLDALTQAASALTGFSHDAILPESMRRSARELLEIWPPAEVLSRIHLGDAQVLQALRLAVSVGETFFFRQPEHFEFIRETLAPGWIARGVERVRVWSAGCATGEEPFSLAAFLQEVLRQEPQIAIEVLGTDLLTRNLAVARAATYGAWSQRPSAPLLAPLLTPLEGTAGGPPLVRVLERVRAVVRFHEHNLLEPSRESEPFDLILCRNVLVYFEPDAARRAIANLCAALAPGGVLMLGSMDLNVAPPDLAREGNPEALIFRKRAAVAGARAPSAPGLLAPRARETAPGAAPRAPAEAAPSSPSSPGADRAPSNPGERARALSAPGVRSSAPSPLPTGAPAGAAAAVSLHLRALLQIEHGELDGAERSLRALLAASPDYLPGLFERALLHSRRGEPAAASSLMREVLRRASALAPGQLVEGPEPLEARFYVESAEAFLRGGRG